MAAPSLSLTCAAFVPRPGDYSITDQLQIKVNASAGVAIIMNSKWKRRVQSYNWQNERIITCRFKIERGYLTVVGVYSPDEGRKEETDIFYNELQAVLDGINKNDYIVIGGDLNARIGNTPVKDIIGINREPTLNQNGKMLRDFVSFNKMRIENTFFKHKEIHKYTWSARGLRSIIDYFIANEKLSKLFRDVRVLRSCDISTDHFLVRGKVDLKTRWYKLNRTRNQIEDTRWKTNLLNEESIRTLYKSRIELYMDQNAVSEHIELEWSKSCF